MTWVQKLGQDLHSIKKYTHIHNNTKIILPPPPPIPTTSRSNSLCYATILLGTVLCIEQHQRGTVDKPLRRLATLEG